MKRRCAMNAHRFIAIVILLVLCLTAHAQQATSFPAIYEGQNLQSLGWNGTEFIVGQRIGDELVWRVTSTATAHRQVYKGNPSDDLRVGQSGEFIVTAYKEQRVYKIANQKTSDLVAGMVSAPAVAGDGNLVYQIAPDASRGGIWRERSRLSQVNVAIVWGYQGETYGVAGQSVGRIIDGLFQPVGGVEVNDGVFPEFLYDPTTGEVAIFQRDRGTVWSLSTGKLLAAIPSDANISKTFSKHFIPYLRDGELRNALGNEPLIETVDLARGETLEIGGGISHDPAAVFGNSLVAIVYRGQWPTRFIIIRKDDVK